jgi:hypothetical protein
MTTKEKILNWALKDKKLKTGDIVSKYNVSRQYANSLVKSLVRDGKLVKIGSTKSAFYAHPKYADTLGKAVNKWLKNKQLKEDEVFNALEKETPLIRSLNENIHSIFFYAFTEMLNNAIEHSKSKNIQIEIKKNHDLSFCVNDIGIGVFKSIMQKRRLKSELEAVQDLLKGKTTTKPRAHSGEGIFFTSKIADIFILESYNYKLTVDNRIKDVFLEELKPSKRGTKVRFYISADSKKHLGDIFVKYQTSPEELAFDKTEILVKLYTMGTIHISRSQARRIMAGLEKFKLIVLDFDQVPTVGQAFADEIFRVFRQKHPDIKIEPINMNETVNFMIKRAS